MKKIERKEVSTLKEKNLMERSETAIMNKIPESLQILNREMDDIGLNQIDFSKFAEHVKVSIENNFKANAAENIDKNRPVLITFGLDDKSSPTALSNSIIFSAIRKVLTDIIEILKEAEESEDKKLANWIRLKTGKDGKILWRSLQAVERDGNDIENVDSWYDIIKMVLAEDRAKLEKLLALIPKDASGEKAFIRDLGKARLSDERIERLLNAMVAANDLSDVALILEADEIKNHAEFPAINHMAKVLKSRLEQAEKTKEECEAQV